MLWNKRFRFDLKGKNLWVGRKQFIEKGEILYDNEVFITDENPSWETVESLYERYKHSCPHKTENRSYFKALSYEELSDGDMMFGADRNEAQFMLELYLLLNGSKLEMRRPTDWFWQGNDRNLIVLKEWL